MTLLGRSVFIRQSVFKLLRVITGEFVKFGPFGLFMCDYVIVRKTMFLSNFERLCRNLVKL